MEQVGVVPEVAEVRTVGANQVCGMIGLSKGPSDLITVVIGIARKSLVCMSSGCLSHDNENELGREEGNEMR